MNPEPGRSVVFDRVAHEYDATRGGEERGRACAATLAPLLSDGRPLLEVGVGTGVVAEGLRDLGRDVVGVDLSHEMLRRAAQRLGARVVRGDAHRLPVRDAAVSGAYSVWVLHLVADPLTVLREVHRVVEPGGRYVVASSAVDPPPEDDEVGTWVWRMQHALRKGAPKPDHPSVLQPLAEEAGWRVVELMPGSAREWQETPARAASVIESRTWSLLWEVTPTVWSSAVQPTIDALRAMPDQERPRLRRNGEWRMVLERS